MLQHLYQGKRNKRNKEIEDKGKKKKRNKKRKRKQKKTKQKVEKSEKKEPTKPKRKVRIADQVARLIWRDPKLLRIDANVHGRAEQGRVAEEGVDGADEEDEALAGAGPLRQACQWGTI
jgi:hypothetical protein